MFRLASARIQRGNSSKSISFPNRKFSSVKSVDGEPKLFDKILIANRGEIACRVVRTAKKLGIKTVAVYSEADKNSMHVAMADEAYLIGEAQSKQSYLRMDRIIDVAKRSGAQAVHPGYGFLSENAEFADYCDQHKVVFIGPPASAIRAMGSKSASKDIMMKANVPLIPGYHGADQSPEKLKAEADRIGYPVLIKAWMGGGGKGMRIVERKEDFDEAMSSAKREAINSFGDDRILVEKYLTEPRHIEMQVFADKFGNAVHLFERDCSVQRRHQKVLEEAPAPLMSSELRSIMGKAAVDAAKAVGYVGAGTVEFIFDNKDKKFYFMEMNTRLQVEHPVTEMITKQDLVEWQIKVASGRKLPMQQSDLKIYGHAAEARIYAENPENNFLPGTGKLKYLKTPTASDVIRVETGVRQGDEVSVYYDPMIAKLVVWAEDRTSALKLLKQSLDEYKIVGLTTNINFLKKLALHPAFLDAKLNTGFIGEHKQDLITGNEIVPPNNAIYSALVRILLEEKSLAKAAQNQDDPFSPFANNNGKRLFDHLTRRMELIFGEENKQKYSFDVTYLDNEEYLIQEAPPVPKKGEKHVTHTPKPAVKVSAKFTTNEDELAVSIDGHVIFPSVVVHDGTKVTVFAPGLGVTQKDLQHLYTFELFQHQHGGASASKGSLLSPMPGRIIKVMVEVGQKVTKGSPLIVMEAMKMEHTIRAPADGVVEKIHYNTNEIVQEKQQLISIKADGDS